MFSFQEIFTAQNSEKLNSIKIATNLKRRDLFDNYKTYSGFKKNIEFPSTKKIYIFNLSSYL